MSEIDFKALAAPIDKGDVKFKPGKGGKQQAFITARVVMNRLDAVVGPQNWRDEYATVPGGVVCTICLRIDGEWVGKSDVGDAGDIEPVKAMYSDALKRAAVKWGIGRELYNDGTAFEDEQSTPAVTVHTPPNPRVPMGREPGAISKEKSIIYQQPEGDADTDWIGKPGALNKFETWAREQWDGELAHEKHFKNRLAKALGARSYDTIMLDVKCTKQQAADAVRNYVSSRDTAEDVTE